MSEVAEWRPLDSRTLNSGELNQPSREEVEGIQIRSYVSPYDVPEAIHIYGSPDKKHYRVVFGYLGGKENIEPETKQGHVILWLGRDSRRLYVVDFDRRQNEVDEVNKAINQLSSEPHTPPRTGNYELVKRVLSSLFTSPDSPLASPAQ